MVFIYYLENQCNMRLSYIIPRSKTSFQTIFLALEEQKKLKRSASSLRSSTVEIDINRSIS